MGVEFQPIDRFDRNAEAESVQKKGVIGQRIYAAVEIKVVVTGFETEALLDVEPEFPIQKQSGLGSGFFSTTVLGGTVGVGSATPAIAAEPQAKEQATSSAPAFW